MTTYTLTIADIRQETTDAVTLCFKQPGLKKIRYKAGQYLTLVFKINNRRYIRPYSFSSAPMVDSFLEVTIKRVFGGIVSNHICDHVKVGDTIEVMEPMGDFVISDSLEATGGNIVLWGVGSGITPLFSIAKYLLAQKANHHITMVYGNRTADTVIFKKHLAELQVHYANSFKLWQFYTQLFVDDNQPFLVQGRIEPSKVLDVLKAEKDIKHTYHYICGPAGLKEAVKTALTNYGVPTNQVFSEDFELVKDEKDFVNVFTQNVTIIKEGVSTVVEVVKGKSILEAGLDALIDMPYSCQTGNCSICKGKIITGSVKQILPKHTDLKADEYQLCCSYPMSADVKFII